MSFEQPTTQKPEQTTEEKPEGEGYYSPEEKERRRIIIEEARKNLREGAARYQEQVKRIEEAFNKLL